MHIKIPKLSLVVLVGPSGSGKSTFARKHFLPTEVRPEDYAALKRLADGGKLRLVDLGIGLDTNFLWFNLRPGAKMAASRARWLQSVELRRAISHAVDRAAFANAVLLGAAVPIYGPVTPAYGDWYSPEVPRYPYDAARARELLAAAGLRDGNGDGMLEDSTGAPASFGRSTSGRPLAVTRQMRPCVWSRRGSRKSTSPCWMIGLYQSAI